MTTQHTPGPWIFGIRDFDDECKRVFIEKPFDYKGPGFFDNPGIFGADGTEVVGCDEYSIFNSPADARLIAAAPDLLEALRKFALKHRHTYGLDGAWDEEITTAEKAIAKATGES